MTHPYISTAIENHHKAVNSFFSTCTEDLEKFADLCANALENGNKILLCGNGGSASDAQHIAAEFVGRFVKDRRPLPSIALTTDTSILTAVGNDYGYDDVFSRQVEGLGVKGDVLIAISTSGGSPNVMKAVESAKEKGIHTICVSGKSGGTLKDVCDMSFVVPVQETARIQECHIMLLHILCGLVEAKMGIGQ